MRLDHFWRHVDKTDPSGCWVWRGKLNRHGYGEHRAWDLASRGKYFAAHRLAWELEVGPIPKGKGHHGTVVAHRCDNRVCCNPSHLFLTTQRGNLRDCIKKGRARKAFGEDAGRAVLTETAVIAIRTEAAQGVDRATLAERHDVTTQTVVDIARRKSWKHLPSRKVKVAKAPRAYNTKPNSGSFQKGCKGNPGPKPEARTADYDAIRALLSSGLSYREIARRTGTTHTTVRRVAGG